MADEHLTQVRSIPDRRFAFLWAASTMSNLADGIGLTAAPLLAATLTRDPGLVAGLTVAQRLPWFLFSLISGALVDRLDRRRVLQRANAFRALLLLVLGLSVLGNWVSLPLLYVIFFLLGTTETLFDNASFAILPTVVEQDRLEHANSRLYATQTVMNEFIGPPLGGTLFGWLATVPFLVSGSAFGISSVLIGLLSGTFRPSRTENTPEMNLLQSIREGMGWFLRQPLLRILAIMVSIINFAYASSFSTLVLYAQDVLKVNDGEYGLLLSTGAIGGVIGGLVASRVAKRVGGGITIFISNIALALALMMIGLTENVIVVGMMLALCSFAAIMCNVVVISLRQSIIPDHLLGRVTSAYRLFALGSPPLGALFGGILARELGLSTPYIVGGAVLIVMTFALLPWVNNRRIAEARSGA